MEQVSVLNIIIIIIAAYFLGSLSFGWMIARLRGVNILEKGSGNPGFTNVWRVLGIKWASLVLILDGAKGYFSAMIGYHLGGELGMMIGFVGRHWSAIPKAGCCILKAAKASPPPVARCSMYRRSHWRSSGDPGHHRWHHQIHVPRLSHRRHHRAVPALF